jgi:hypothetical protein
MTLHSPFVMLTHTTGRALPASSPGAATLAVGVGAEIGGRLADTGSGTLTSEEARHLAEGATTESGPGLSIVVGAPEVLSTEPTTPEIPSQGQPLSANEKSSVDDFFPGFGRSRRLE